MFNNDNDNFLEKLGFFPVNILDSMVNNSYGVFFYQRRYKWELDNIQAYLSFFKLNYIEDQIYSFPQPIHIKEHPQGFEIIDGQQRYITTKLILLALYNIIINKYDKDTLGYDENDQNVFNKINEIIFKKDHNNKFLFQTKLSLSNGDQNKFNKFLDWFYETDEEDITNELQGNDFYLNYKIIYEQLSELDKDKIVLFYKKFSNTYFVVRKEFSDSYELFKSINTSALPLELFEIVKAILIKSDEDDSILKNNLINIENNLRTISEEKNYTSKNKNKDKTFKEILTHFLHIYYYEETTKTITFGSLGGHSNNDYIKVIEKSIGNGSKKERLLFTKSLNNYLEKYLMYMTYDSHMFNNAYKSASKLGKNLDMLRESLFPFTLYCLLDTDSKNEEQILQKRDILDGVYSNFITRRYLYEVKYFGFSDVNWIFYKRFYKLMDTYSNKTLEENYTYFFGSLIEKELISDTKILNIVYPDHSEIRKVLLTLDNTLSNPSLEHIIPKSYDDELNFTQNNNSIGNVFIDYLSLSKSIYSIGNFTLIDLNENQRIGNLSPYNKLDKLDSLGKRMNLKQKYIDDIKNYKFDDAEIKLRGKELVDDIQKQEHVNWTFGNKHYNNYHALKTQYKEEDLKVENKEDILAAIEKQISFCGNSIGFIAYNEMEDNFKNGRDVYLNNNEEIVKKYLKTKSSILSKYYEKLDQEEIEKYLINKITKQMTIVQYYSKILQLNEEKGLYILEYQIKGKDGKKNYDDFLKEAPIKYPLTIVGQGSNHKVKIFGKNE